MTDTDIPLAYRLELVQTDASTGYFACLPPESMSLENCLAYLNDHPFDTFMRRHVLERMGAWGTDRIEEEIQRADGKDALFVSLLYEVLLLSGSSKPALKKAEHNDLKQVLRQSPLIYFRCFTQKKQRLHQRWIAHFRSNIFDHHPLPSPEKTRLPFPCTNDQLEKWDKAPLPIETIRNQAIATDLKDSTDKPPAAESARFALDALKRIDVIESEIQRHQASLAVIALLRRWKLNVSVSSGRHNYSMAGTQTAYGRGLLLEDAEASLAMEMVERVSSFASFGDGRVLGYQNIHRLTRGTYSELKKGAVQVLDPNNLCLEAPYHDEPLYWIQGQTIGDKGLESILVPAQCVFLFCNLDEINLFSGLGSTGLASGNTLEQAKVNALLEVVERDHEGTTPFDLKQCFHVETRNEFLNALLNGYMQQGIQVQFQDLTSSMGIPCCKCFVIDDRGSIIKGVGAHLDAAKALLSALTETPFPFPSGPPSGPGLKKLMRVPLENLPDYTTGSFSKDLFLLEKILSSHGLKPIYVDLTRKDLKIPVVRVIVPGMEIAADFEWYSRVHPKLFLNYLKIFRHGF